MKKINCAGKWCWSSVEGEHKKHVPECPAFKSRRRLVSVTRKHITCGSRSEHTCPVALALVDAGYKCYVFSDGILTVTEGDCGLVKLLPPRSVQRFVNAFDEHKKVKPFKFYLNLPEST